jgi:hypothetical protein
VFQALADGRLLAYSADKGEKLLDIQTGLRGGVGPPVTWQAGEKQYVSVMGGIGAAAAPGGTQNAGGGRGATTSGIPAAPPARPKLLTFVLDGKTAITGSGQ